jgi:hypothetical protein
LKDKKIYSGSEFDYEKNPSDDYKDYGDFDCIAKDIMSLKGGLQGIKTYAFVDKCTVTKDDL